MRNGINKKERQASAASGPIVLDSRRCPFTLSVFFFLSFFVFFSFAPRHQHDISASFFLLSRRPLLLLLCHVLFIRIGATRLPLARTSRSHFYFSGRFLLIFAVYAISRATVLLSLFIMTRRSEPTLNSGWWKKNFSKGKLDKTRQESTRGPFDSRKKRCRHCNLVAIFGKYDWTLKMVQLRIIPWEKLDVYSSLKVNKTI